MSGVELREAFDRDVSVGTFVAQMKAITTIYLTVCSDQNCHFGIFIF